MMEARACAWLVVLGFESAALSLGPGKKDEESAKSLVRSRSSAKPGTPGPHEADASTGKWSGQSVQRLLRPGIEHGVHTCVDIDPLDPIGPAGSSHHDEVILLGDKGQSRGDVAYEFAVDINLRGFGLAQFDGAEGLVR